MTVHNVPASLRGALSRWLIEPDPGIFVGNPSQRIRDELWKLALGKLGKGSVLQIWSSPTPQGFQYRAAGLHKRQLRDYEGLALVWEQKEHPPKTLRRLAAVTRDRASDTPSGDSPSEEDCGKLSDHRPSDL